MLEINIKLTINDTEHIISYENAKELHSELDKLFGHGTLNGPASIAMNKAQEALEKELERRNKQISCSTQDDNCCDNTSDTKPLSVDSSKLEDMIRESEQSLKDIRNRSEHIEKMIKETQR
jgi:hypothetical protein